MVWVHLALKVPEWSCSRCAWADCRHPESRTDVAVERIVTARPGISKVRLRRVCFSCSLLSYCSASSCNYDSSEFASSLFQPLRAIRTDLTYLAQLLPGLGRHSQQYRPSKFSFQRSLWNFMTVSRGLGEILIVCPGWDPNEKPTH